MYHMFCYTILQPHPLCFLLLLFLYLTFRSLCHLYFHRNQVPESLIHHVHWKSPSIRLVGPCLGIGNIVAWKSWLFWLLTLLSGQVPRLGWSVAPCSHIMFITCDGLNNYSYTWELEADCSASITIFFWQQHVTISAVKVPILLFFEWYLYGTGRHNYRDSVSVFSAIFAWYLCLVLYDYRGSVLGFISFNKPLLRAVLYFCQFRFSTSEKCLT